MKQFGISVIGAGRVAGALCRQMNRRGLSVVTIVSQSGSSAVELATALNSTASAGLFFDESSDLIIVAVPDDSIKDVLAGIRCCEKTIVAHTAGTIGLDIFPPSLKHTGVFYPLQTFSAGREIDFDNLPFLIEASDELTSGILTGIAEKLGSKVHYVDTGRRKMLHVAAVYVCNFTNHMLTAGKEIASEAGFGFAILEPLIRETFSKALGNGPELSQTGPAIRYDTGTIEKHIGLLSFSADLQKLYREITESIINHYKQS